MTEKTPDSVNTKKIPTSLEMRNQARENMKKAGLDEKDISAIRSGSMNDPEKIMKANKAWAEANPNSPLTRYLDKIDVNFSENAALAVEKVKALQTSLGQTPDGIVGEKTSKAWNKHEEQMSNKEEKSEAQKILADFDNTLEEDQKRYKNIVSQAASNYSDPDELEKDMPEITEILSGNGNDRFMNEIQKEQVQKLTNSLNKPDSPEYQQFINDAVAGMTGGNIGDFEDPSDKTKITVSDFGGDLVAQKGDTLWNGEHWQSIKEYAASHENSQWYKNTMANIVADQKADFSKSLMTPEGNTLYVDKQGTEFLREVNGRREVWNTSKKGGTWETKLAPQEQLLTNISSAYNSIRDYFSKKS